MPDSLQNSEVTLIKQNVIPKGEKKLFFYSPELALIIQIIVI